MFKDRRDAGERLAEALAEYKNIEDGMVIALPRGGVVLGRIVADRLNLPLDIVVPRKIGAPQNREYAIGALTEAGDAVWNEAERARCKPAEIEAIVKEERAEAIRRLKKYRIGLPTRIIKERIVLLVDDGIATGLTMRAAVKTIRGEKPRKLVMAVPVAPPETAEEMEKEVDEMVVLETPTAFTAVGACYEQFGEVADEEVISLLHPEQK